MKVISKQTNSRNCIICGLDNELGVKAPFYILEDGSVGSIFQFKFEHQSYPDRTHGGMIAAFLDEITGRALWVHEPDTYGVTTTMNIKFRKPVPYGVMLKARSVITYNTPRGFSSRGEIYDMNDNLLAQAEGKYLKLPFEKISTEGVSKHEEMCYDIPDNVNEIDFPPMKDV